MKKVFFLILLTLCFSANAFASISMLHAASDTSFTGGSTATISLTVNGSADFLEIDWFANACVASITGVTWNGVSMTQHITSTLTSDLGDGIAIYGLVAPATGTHNLVISFSPSCSFGGVVIEKDWSGVDQTTPVDDTAAINNSYFASSPETLSITTSTNGVASDAMMRTGGTVTVSGGQTQDANTAFGSDATAASHLLSATAMSWTFTGTPTNTFHAIIALKEASGGCTPDHLTVDDQPANAVLGASVGAITIGIYDSGNNHCGSATNTVTLSKTSGQCTGMTLNGTVSGAATSGDFTTTNVNMTVATGTCTLDATASGLTGTVTSSFTISPATTYNNDFMMFAN